MVVRRQPESEPGDQIVVSFAPMAARVIWQFQQPSNGNTWKDMDYNIARELEQHYLSEFQGPWGAVNSPDSVAGCQRGVPLR